MTDPAATKAIPGEQRFTTWENRIRAFVTIGPTAISTGDGTLAGRTVGVKDVIDVAGLPTRNGSRTCAAAGPAAADAPVVARLRAAGAQIVGKTVTTEFAFTDPTPCRNPWSLERSPGGSSSGSGAAVGAGILDIALGTQTAGSLIRPAAYCGAVGFKPGQGVLPMAGITPLSPSHDMVGVIAKDVRLAAAAFAEMRAAPSTDSRQPRYAGRLLLSREARIDDARQAAWDAVAGSVADRLGTLRTLEPGIDVAATVADHRTVMCAEAAAVHGALLEDATRGLLMPNFRAALEGGRATDPAAAARAGQRLAGTRAAFWDRHAEIDIFVTPPVPEGPPRLGASTGFQHWLTVWTVLGGPLLCLPWGLDPDGLPVSVMLAGRPGQDEVLLAFGAEIAASAPQIPLPPLPNG